MHVVRGVLQGKTERKRGYNIVTQFAPATAGKPTTQQVHEVQPPPEDSQLVRDVAVILASAAAIYVMANAIEALLKPWKIGRQAIMAAIGISNRGTAALPNARLAANSITSGEPAAAQAQVARNAELYFRAAYVVNAARRIQKDLSAGEPLRKAISDEAKHYHQHESARRERLDTAAKVGRAADRFGDLLGWYLDPLLNNESECIAANGNNFYASQGTILGLPGAVHPNCGCYAGPAHEGAGLVNDAVAHLIHKVPAPRMFRLKKARAA